MMDGTYCLWYFLASMSKPQVKGRLLVDACLVAAWAL